MNSVLLWLGGLLVAVLGLLFAVPYVVDWNAYRGVFEEEATRILGREVRVGGKVNLRLLPSPYVRFEKVRIADTEALTGEPFFRAESFTLWLATPPLLRGAFEVDRIELDRPVLRLVIDAKGRGNWQSLQIAPGALPYMPSEVVLQHVRIRGGALSVKMPSLSEPVALTGIDGELSAGALAGPYRFRGNVDWHGTPHELRLTTAAQEPEGPVRFKASLQVPGGGGSYTLDGALSELTPSAKLTGMLNARVPVRQLENISSARGAGRESGSDGRSAAAGQATTFELKSAVEATIDTLRLPDISIAFEQDSKPQLLEGQIAAAWSNGLTLRTQLQSRWLDVDRIIGSNGKGTSPLEAARQLIARLGSLLPGAGNSLLMLNVDQINLGGEAISGVRLALAHAGGLTSIGELKADLPGNTSGELRGTLGKSAKDQTFNGEFLLHGPSYKRFAVWALGASADALTAKGDGAFSLSSRLQLQPDRMKLSAARLEFGTTELGGDVDWRWGKAPALSLKLEGGAVDLSSLVPDLLDLGGRQQAEDGRQTAAASRGPVSLIGAKAERIAAAVGNLDVDLQASYLTDGARALHDVVAQLDVGNGSITFKRLHFNTSSGLDLDLQGRLDRLNENPSGRLRGWVNALDPRSVSSLIDGLDVGHGPLAGPWMHNLSKVELGFTADFGPRSPRALVIDANGTVDGARVEIDLSLGGGLEGWRARPVDLTVRLNSPQAHGLLRKLTTGERVLPGGSDGPGMLLIKSAGENAASLLTFVRLEAPRALTVFNGRTSITEAGFIDLDGVAQVRFDTIRDALSLARMTRLPNVGRISARGKVTVKRAEGSTILGSSGDFAVDGVGVSGKLAVSTGGEGKVSLDGKLGTESASIPKLLGLMLAGRPSDAASPAADTGLNGPSPWPEAPFALDIVRNVEGRLAITTPTLKLDDGLAVSDAAMTVDIKPGLVSLTSLTGKASGGRVAVKSTFRNTSAGADVSIEGRLNGAQLALMAGTGMVQPNGASRGSADIALRLSGRALSPRTVISALKGSGEIVLHDVVLTGISSRAVDDAAAELIDREGAITGEALEAALTKRLAAGKLALGSRRIGIGIGDGALRIDSFDIDTERARITNTSTIDLATLKIDSEWKMQPLKQLVVGRKTLTKTPLPSVSLVWTGPIQGVAAQSPRISLGALERELVVRKMERDVERLEDLRRSDDERMRHETERLRRERLNRGSVPPNPVRQGAPAKVPPPVIVAPLPLNSLPPAGDASIDAARRVPPSALTAGQAEAATSPAGSLNGQQPTSSAPAPVPRRVRPRPPPPPAFVPPFGD